MRSTRSAWATSSLASRRPRCRAARRSASSSPASSARSRPARRSTSSTSRPPACTSPTSTSSSRCCSGSWTRATPWSSSSTTSTSSSRPTGSSISGRRAGKRAAPSSPWALPKTSPPRRRPPTPAPSWRACSGARRPRRRSEARAEPGRAGDLGGRAIRCGQAGTIRPMNDPVQPPDDVAHLRAILPRIPSQPGVYRFMGAAGEVLYVGKAKELRKRVSSYFRRSGTPHGRTPEMLAQARDIEWVVTASEGEALLLEDNFIKEARPPYNLRLRDDKSYPFIEITLRDEWPRVRFFRGRHVAGNLYFGPYSSARKVRDLSLIHISEPTRLGMISYAVFCLKK